MTTELGRLIAHRIALTGPISIADFMTEALGHPRLGYYRRAMPLGAEGDFTTAPEISQMFGELLGAWLADRWLTMGSPASVRLVELGPGRGTLMADALRATRGVPGFHAALDLHLVETSGPLRTAQQTALAAFAPTWHEHFDEVPAGPLLLVANEFFDALPVRQFHRTAEGWRERMVGLAPDGTLRLALAPGLTPFASALADAAPGAEAEFSEAGRALAAAIGARLHQDGGWALIIDYGYDSSTPGSSLQAVRGHRGADILARPGETDLSAHVDFAALAAASGRPTFGPVAQGDFLRRLGILERAHALKRQASPEQGRALDAALARLIAPDQMGTLFRVLAMGDDRSAQPAGFSDTPSDAT
ncbi:class I SAM-dependent methyltransferase [Reyranella sp.]|uniref:class I SAM-dependent methyltransferase n=1 Tax=Reyranella sp. TaxID=1929291 RepID=UPI002731DBD1|nr:SAM-dependent methyltransferase [Reyranella sp.]MDP2375090.1 SAM-dependent methyltransferase [Reyranella sp.]